MARTPRARAVAWNVGPRSAREIVHSLWNIVVGHPRVNVLALFEAGRAEAEIREAFGGEHGPWRIYRPDDADAILLVAKTLPPPEVSVIGHDAEWVGPKLGIAHRGRIHLVADWDNLRVLFVHGVPGGPGGGKDGHNRAAWIVDRALIAHACRERDVPTVCIGDQNATVDELVRYWRGLGMRPIRTGAKVDHGARRGVRARAKRLANYGSDHPAICYPIRRRPR